MSLRFHGLFHSPGEVHFSPFPHGTISLSVTQEYLVLRGGPRGFTRDFTCPMLLGIHKILKTWTRETSCSQQSWLSFELLFWSTTGLSPSLVQLSTDSFWKNLFIYVPQPLFNKSYWILKNFRLFPLRSPLLRESLLLFLPLATKMFQFTRFSLPFLWIQKGVL